MRRHTVVLSWAVLFSCGPSHKPKTENAQTEHNYTSAETTRVVEKEPQENFRFDTVTIDSKIFIACQSNLRNLVVTNENQDTVYDHPDWTNGIEFTDFNDDGYPDILLEYMTNVPGVVDLALFEKSTGTFRLVDNFHFPSPQKVQGTKYRYSYHRSGCADSDWDSDLFYLNGYTPVRIGNIHGSGCEGNEKNGIFISKVTNDKKTLVTEIIRESGYYDDKFDFIKEYWSKNYKLFD